MTKAKVAAISYVVLCLAMSAVGMIVGVDLALFLGLSSDIGSGITVVLLGLVWYPAGYWFWCLRVWKVDIDHVYRLWFRLIDD